MKKLRSNVPRRKRTHFSPLNLRSNSSFPDSASNLTRDVAVSCDSSSVNNNPVNKKKKMCFAELSESESCVDLCSLSSKYVIQNDDYDVVSVASQYDPVVKSCEITSNVNNNSVTERAVNDDYDVVSVASHLEYDPAVKSGEITSYINNDNNSVTERAEKDDYDVVSVASRLEYDPVLKSGEIASYINNDLVAERADDENEDCGESKVIIPVDIDLTCSESLSWGDDESDGLSSGGCSDGVIIIESSETGFSSDFGTLSWYDSGSQFSERSFGDPVPSPTFQLFLIYSQKFYRSEFAAKVSEEHCYKEPSNRVIKLLRPEDEEHEESYQMMKKRERRQVYLHDYAEEYCEMTDYGYLVVQQRLQMVHWIMEESAKKDLQKETMFLSVSLLDRFLSKGYFRNQMEFEIAGIACLTLATRLEETQPYNSIQQTLFTVGSNEYSRSQVVAMEWLVQDVLNFQCYLPTIYNFLWFYLKAVRSDEDVDKMAKYLAMLALLGHEQLCYWPSTVAASLVTLACLAENEKYSLQQIAWIHNGSDDKDLPDCIKSLEWLIQYIS